MDHNEALKSEAVERYILNEMSDGERDRFEEHYFDCRECGADVLAGERLMANGRAVVREPVVVPFPPRPWWKSWTPAAAAAMLLAVNVGFVVTRLGVPLRASGPTSEIVQAQPVHVGMNRDAGQPPYELRAGVTNALVVNILPDPQFVSYELRLLDRAGKPVVPTQKVKESEQGVHWLLSSLPAGSYVMAIYGVREDGNRPVIATYEVRVQ